MCFTRSPVSNPIASVEPVTRSECSRRGGDTWWWCGEPDWPGRIGTHRVSCRGAGLRTGEEGVKVVMEVREKVGSCRVWFWNVVEDCTIGANCFRTLVTIPCNHVIILHIAPSLLWRFLTMF